MANLPPPPYEQDEKKKHREQYHASPLHAAIEERHFGLVDRLLELGSDVNAHAPLSASGTALASAARWGHVELMKKLVDKGADPTLAGCKYG